MIKTLKRYLHFLLVLVFLPASMAAESQEDIKIGEKIYTEQCVLCHGPAGEGWDWEKKWAKPPFPVPNLLKVLPERSDEYLVTVIKLGGSAVGLTDFMPALGFNLTDREVLNLVAYLRVLKPKPPADGSFFEKSAPSQPENLVWAPRMSRFLVQFQSPSIIAAALIRPAAFLYRRNPRTHRPFYPKLKEDIPLLAQQHSLGQNAGQHHTGSFPHAITLGDFNSDGHSDFAIPASAARKLAVLLGDGKGGILSNHHYPVGQGPTWVTTADLNQDGHLDLITTNTGAGSLSLYYGDGKGDFHDRKDIEEIHGTPCVVAGDFNQDGLPDLAVTQAKLSKVVILTNDSTGIPKRTHAIDEERGPHIMDVVDLNQDEIPDLVVGSLGSHTLSIMIANGKGTFEEANVVKVGRFPHYRAYGDWNGDGHVDAAVAVAGEESVEVLMGNGRGALKTLARY